MQSAVNLIVNLDGYFFRGIDEISIVASMLCGPSFRI
jgi:hypothetical protein